MGLSRIVACMYVLLLFVCIFCVRVSSACFCRSVCLSRLGRHFLFFRAFSHMVRNMVCHGRRSCQVAREGVGASRTYDEAVRNFQGSLPVGISVHTRWPCGVRTLLCTVHGYLCVIHVNTRCAFHRDLGDEFNKSLSNLHAYPLPLSLPGGWSLAVITEGAIIFTQ